MSRTPWSAQLFERRAREAHRRSGGTTWPTDRALPPANITEHRHTCPDGTEVLARSQHIAITGTTLDRFYVAGHPVGTSARPGNNTEPPSFAWADTRAPQEGTTDAN